jgi:hypothetical protein
VLKASHTVAEKWLGSSAMHNSLKSCRAAMRPRAWALSY